MVVNNSEWVGNWWNDRNIQLWRIDGNIYALYGWNGERYLHCWQVAENLIDSVDNKEYEISPIYRYQVEGKEFPDESAEDFDDLIETVGYTVYA